MIIKPTVPVRLDVVVGLARLPRAGWGGRHLTPKIVEETLSEINSFSFDNFDFDNFDNFDNFDQSSDSAEEIIIQWFYSPIEPGDLAQIVSAFQAAQK